MADLTATELADLRADIGDEGSTPAFSDAELQRLYDRVDNDYDSTVVLAIRQLMVNAAKFADYTAGESSVKKHQIFDNLKKTYELLTGEIASGDQVLIAGSRAVPYKSREEPDS